MDPSRLALVQGMADTRRTLARWNAAPWPVLRTWLLGAAAVALALLLAVWAVAAWTTPDSSRLLLPGLNEPAGPADVGRVLLRNGLVLLLHALACVAGFIAGSSLPLQAAHHDGLWRRVHERAGPSAIAFVVCATAFSLATQAFVLGGDAATLAAQLGIPVPLLLLTLLPHALPELVALFLPLAAWTLASRRGRWEELLAATFATSALAVPVLVVTANLEVFVWPHLMRAASPLA
ncbi:MAG TPA: hypothetical protein VLA98_06720 [Solirubrobacteraceae bacterium]|nr:hypothetical protein [Solirubrobacteraceae bacterium]HSD80998.1 hypothetical protein [Solirubrobacteraceae bacterium]